MRALIIGCTGCAGSHLADFLLTKGYEVYGTKRTISSRNNIKHILDKIELLDIDLALHESISRIFEKSKPDHVYFLASQGSSYSTKHIYETNVQGALLFFETAAALHYRPKFILASSSAVYGMQKDPYPITENNPLLPSNHYALSKMFQEEIAKYFFLNYDIDITIARPFNHPGPRENPALVCSDFARQIVEIEKGKKKPFIRVGDLDSKRDFTDVRDVVRAYYLLAEKGGKGEIYNICSGKGYSIKIVLDELISMSTAAIEVETDSTRFRTNEVRSQVGDNSKLFSQIGWKPQIQLEVTLKDVLNYYRKRVS